MSQLTGIRYKGRTVRCNNQEDGRPENNERGERKKGGERGERKERREKRVEKKEDNGNWRDLMRIATEDNRRGKKQQGLRGEEPDFTEEGWARRKPKKKK